MKLIVFLSILFSLNTVLLLGQISRQQAIDDLQKTGVNYPDSTRINALLHLAEYEVLKPGENKADLDSATKYLNRAEILQEGRHNYLGYKMLIKYLIKKETNKTLPPRFLLERAINQLKSDGDLLHLAHAYLESAKYIEDGPSGPSPEKIKTLEIAAEFYRVGGDQQQQAWVLEYIADIVSSVNIESGFKHAWGALDVYKKINYPDLQGVYIIL